MSLGKIIIQRRKVLEITQRELATGLGLTPQHISLLEQNKLAPSLTLPAGLAKELGVSAEDAASKVAEGALKAAGKVSSAAKETVQKAVTKPTHDSRAMKKESKEQEMF